MEGRQLQVMERAMMWAADKDRREVKVEYKQIFSGQPMTLKVYVYDNNIYEGGALPEGFIGNINDYLCTKKQTDMQSSIDMMTASLKQMEDNGGCEE